MALSENSTKCPIGAGFRISRFWLKSAVLVTAACPGAHHSAGLAAQRRAILNPPLPVSTVLRSARKPFIL